MRWEWLLLGGLLAGCERPRPPAPSPPEWIAAQPVVARVSRSGGQVVIAAVPASGTRINAQLPPQLEFPSGASARLTSRALTSDSAYFATPPEIALPDSTSLAGVQLRLSICDSGAAICRVIVVPL